MQLARVSPIHHAFCRRAQGVRKTELVFTWGDNGLPVALISCDVVSESLAKGDLQPPGAGGTAATVFAGGILGLEGISTHFAWPVASISTCLPPTLMTRILLRLASP